MASVADLIEVLRRKAGMELVNHTPSPSRLRILTRLPLDRGGMNMNNWKVLMDRLLRAAAMGRPWSVDISKNYFLKDGDKLVYAWRLLFQGENIAQHLADIINVISTSPGAARPELTEARLYGVSADRNNPAGGKAGAGAMGKIAVGAAAARIKSLGG